MYVPATFAETAPDALTAIIRRHAFALLVSTGDDGVPFATHLPFLYDAAQGPHGRLSAHMARANPHAALLDGRPALVVFAGPHAYVSPSWYGQHPSVPTWNYVAIHAYGAPRVIDDRDAERAMMRRLVADYEADRPDPWTMDGLPDSYVAGMQRGIVAFEMPVDRLEGKFKLSQNRPEADRTAVAAALAAEGGEAAEVAALMRQRD